MSTHFKTTNLAIPPVKLSMLQLFRASVSCHTTLFEDQELTLSRYQWGENPTAHSNTQVYPKLRHEALYFPFQNLIE